MQLTNENDLGTNESAPSSQSGECSSLFPSCLHGAEPVGSPLPGEQMVGEFLNGHSCSLLQVTAQLGEGTLLPRSSNHTGPAAVSSMSVFI
jgi:hypothetical protein